MSIDLRDLICQYQELSELASFLLNVQHGSHVGGQVEFGVFQCVS